MANGRNRGEYPRGFVDAVTKYTPPEVATPFGAAVDPGGESGLPQSFVIYHRGALQGA
jgi:hypothetical protein